MSDAPDLGLVLAGQYLTGDDATTKLQHTIEQVRLARDCGFSSIWVTQHFLADFKWLQPVPLLSRLAADAGEMTLGTSVLLAPYYPAVLLAEEIATLDTISGGRFVLGVGSGYRDIELDHFGIARPERADRLRETIDALRLLWSGETVDYDGQYVQLKGAKLQLTPALGDRLPIWVGASGPKGIRQAAQIGNEWLATPKMTLEELKTAQDFFKEDCAFDPSSYVFPILREAFASTSFESAVSTASPALATKYEAYSRWGASMSSGTDGLLEDVFILGDVDRCAEQIERYTSGLGSRFLGLRMEWPGLDQADVLRSIELFGDVIGKLSSR